MRSLLLTLGFAVLTALMIIRATERQEDEDRVTLSPPIPAMVVGPPGISDATFEALFRQGDRIIDPTDDSMEVAERDLP